MSAASLASRPAFSRSITPSAWTRLGWLPSNSVIILRTDTQSEPKRPIETSLGGRDLTINRGEKAAKTESRKG